MSSEVTEKITTECGLCRTPCTESSLSARNPSGDAYVRMCSYCRERIAAFTSSLAGSAQGRRGPAPTPEEV